MFLKVSKGSEMFKKFRNLKPWYEKLQMRQFANFQTLCNSSRREVNWIDIISNHQKMHYVNSKFIFRPAAARTTTINSTVQKKMKREMGRENSWQKQEGVVVLWNARIYSIFCEYMWGFLAKMNSWFITDYSDPLQCWIFKINLK